MSKVYLYIPYVSEHATGMQRFASEMVAALGRAGVDADLIVGEVHGQPAWLSTHRYTVVLGRWSKRLPRAVAALLRVVWLQTVFPFRAERGATLLALAHELAPVPAVRQVAVVHDLTDFRAFAGRGGVGTRVRNWLWRVGLSRSGAVIAISEATRRDLATMLGIAGVHVSVVYEGVDQALFSPTARLPSVDGAGQPFLLYVGTLDPHKNVAFLLSVYSDLVRRGLGVDLVLVGRQPPETVRALMASLPVEIRSGVRWAGFVKDPELARLLATCTAFVFPSLNEGFGLAVAEAMACGAPVVSSDAGSLAEVIAGGGVLLAPDNLGAWVSALERVLTDVSHRQHLAEQALARSRIFSWDRAAEAYRQILKASRP